MRKFTLRGFFEALLTGLVSYMMVVGIVLLSKDMLFSQEQEEDEEQIHITMQGSDGSIITEPYMFEGKLYHPDEKGIVTIQREGSSDLRLIHSDILDELVRRRRHEDFKQK